MPSFSSGDLHTTMRKLYRSVSVWILIIVVAAMWIVWYTDMLSLTGKGCYVAISQKDNSLRTKTSGQRRESIDSLISNTNIDEPDDRLLHKTIHEFNSNSTTVGLAVNTPSFEYDAVQKRLSSLQLKLDDIRHDKWIIITSIALPTEDVKYLAGLKGWKVLIVADSVTPTSWSYPNCVFLSVEKQHQMGSSLVPIVPYGIYGRKTVGYVYAIAHGAQLIYETDDDNRPLDDLKSYVFTDRMAGLMYAGDRLFNPYRHYGQSTLWPRGYPLSKIAAFSSNAYRLGSDWKTPVIQQGVVNGDPDMDAIFRLSRKLANRRLDVIFDPAGPPTILPEGVFSPYNAQNTLFHKNAFWGLYLSQVPTFRVTDIWRSYWNQRLLWEIGERFGYFPPNAYQIRNAHNYLEDFEKEEQLYSSTEALLDFLYSWTCPEADSFFQCVYRLSLDMAAKDFWKDIDAEGVKRWLEDLVRMGYPEPKRVPWISTGSRSYNRDPKMNVQIEARRRNTLSKGTYVQFIPAEQVSPTINRHGPSIPVTWFKQTEHIASICPNIKSLSLSPSVVNNKVRSHFKDILLVVVFRYPYYRHVHLLEALFRALFPNIAYCGWDADAFFDSIQNSSLVDKVSFLNVPNFQNGYLAYTCASKAINMNLNVTGHLFIRDDEIVNLWKLYRYNKDDIWTYRDFNHIETKGNVTWSWWYKNIGRKAYSSAIRTLRHWKGNEPPVGVTPPNKFLRTLASNIGEFPNAVHAPSDIYYIPKRLREDVLFYFDFFASQNVLHELAVPTVFRGLEDANRFQKISGEDLYKLGREDAWEYHGEKATFQHPIKFLNSSTVEKLCSSYLLLLNNGKNSAAQTIVKKNPQKITN